MTGAKSVRTVAEQLRTLSADEENQPIIAREEGCMRALVGFLDDDDLDIASIAVTALRNLASHPDNYRALRTEEGLVEALKELIVAPGADKALRKDVFHVLEEVTDEDNDDELDELDELERRAGLKMDTATQYSISSSPTTLDDPNLLPDPVTVRVHVPGISDDIVCARVEQLIIQKRGVVSVAFEVGAEIAVVYSRFPVEQLASFLTTMTGSHVEILPDLADEQEDDEEDDEQQQQQQHRNNVGEMTDTSKGTQSGYLDTSGQRLKDVAKRGKKKHTISQGASSLHERLKAQREEESRKKARANRLMDLGRGVRSGWGFF